MEFEPDERPAVDARIEALHRMLERERAGRRSLEALLQCRSDELSATYKELQQAYAELDGRVDERTRSLSEAIRLLQSEIDERLRAEGELREERDRAEVATEGLRFALDESERLRAAAEVAARMKAEFLANMSHEIRTPMNGILGMVQLLETTPLSGTQNQYLETVRTSADALLALINDILDLSKIEAGGIELESIPFDLRETVENVGDLLATRAHEKNVELVVRYGPRLPAVLRGDRDRLRQVLVNLIGNAVKFTPSGHVLLHVLCERVEHGKAHLTIDVKDTGIGIEAGKLEVIFEKFTQADGSTTRLFGGTGLGLSISRDLAKLMGGTLTAESRLGEGSTFRLRLRLPVEEAARAAVPVPEDAPRALVLDSSPLTRCVLVESLGERGIRSDEQESLLAFRRAIAKAGPTPPWQWILAEIGSVEMAREIVQSVRAKFGNAAPTMIAVTRLGDGAERNRIRETGFQGVLLKPIRPSRIQDLLEPRAASVWNITSQGGDGTAERADTISLDGIRILVAEDNAVNQRVAQGILEKLGCTVELAGDGREALDIVRDRTPDLVFMDCQMPTMDGYEATRQIRGLDGAAGQVPIVAMTAHAMGGDRERCLAAGMSDYVAKPVRVASIREAVERWAAKAEPAVS